MTREFIRSVYFDKRWDDLSLDDLTEEQKKQLKRLVNDLKGE
jgi:hypothetical protein